MLTRRVRWHAPVLVALALLTASAHPGCGGGDVAEEGPALPPATSMDFDISLFASASKRQFANFSAAAFRIWWLEASVARALVVPAASLAAAMSVAPVFSGGRWIWDFETVSGGKTYGAHLEGWFDGGAREGTSLNLEMRLTCSGCTPALDDFLSYDGHFEVEEARGRWQFYSPEIGTTNRSLVRVDYLVPDATRSTLEVVNNRADGHQDAGDEITLAIDGDSVLLSVRDESQGLDYTAGWSATTTAGWLQVPNYNAGVKACWDDAHVDTDCPQ